MFAARFCLLGALTLSIASAQSLTVVNPDFSAVSIQCSPGWAYEANDSPGGNCQSTSPEQQFNGQPGIGWTFAPLKPTPPHPPCYPFCYTDGITGANTDFNPPPFTGLPFSYAGILQGATSSIEQAIQGFTPGRYVLSFYLGSRYGTGQSGGYQTVLATLDDQLLGIWSLKGFTPFTLQTAKFNVATPGTHLLAFRGVTAGGQTAFFSGVSIAAAQ